MTTLAESRIATAGRRPKQPTAPLGPWLLVAPLVLYLLVFYALPVAAMLMRSVTDPHWTLANYARLPTDPVFLRVLSTTLTTAAVVTIGTILLGYPVALAMVRARPMASNVILAGVLLPFWTSALVRSYAWMVLLGRHGLINEALTAAGLIETPLRLLNTALATHIAMIHILLPYAILPLASVLRQIDGALLRAAFWQVTLPLIRPGILVGGLFAFISSFDELIVSLFLSGTGAITLPRRIWDDLRFALDPTIAAVSTLTIAVTLIVLGSVHLARRRSERLRIANAGLPE